MLLSNSLASHVFIGPRKTHTHKKRASKNVIVEASKNVIVVGGGW